MLVLATDGRFIGNMGKVVAKKSQVERLPHLAMPFDLSQRLFLVRPALGSQVAPSWQPFRRPTKTLDCGCGLSSISRILITSLSRSRSYMLPRVIQSTKTL